MCNYPARNRRSKTADWFLLHGLFGTAPAGRSSVFDIFRVLELAAWDDFAPATPELPGRDLGWVTCTVTSIFLGHGATRAAPNCA